MTVWDALVGQRHAVEALRRAVDGHGMTHAWLFTGPPGSGRSNAALAFAAALQCEKGGCGECNACRTTLAGSHSDVSITQAVRMQISVAFARDLVLKAALIPATGNYQVMVIEDADRLHERAADALLKAIEEPTPRTVWLLCAPTVEDVPTTIRSRCRSVVLATPSAAEVTTFLTERCDVPESVAAFAARASQGHIGRARALAVDEEVRNRRREVVTIPTGLTSLASCLNAAANLMDIAKQETAALTDEANVAELGEIQALYGSDPKARSSRNYRAAVKSLEADQKQRARRLVLDVIDRSLMDLLSVYRDAIALQTGAEGALVNEEIRRDVEGLARASTPETNLRRITAVFTAREQMQEFNAAPLLALESMMVALHTR